MRTHLPDGGIVESAAAGYVLDRALFDKALAVLALQAGARIWTDTRAIARSPQGVEVRTHGRRRLVACSIVIGADGPRSTVAGWMNQRGEAFIDAQQVELALETPADTTEVFFDPRYIGGYGWLFPKGSTANVGVGVNRGMGGDPATALEHLLARLEMPAGRVIGRTAGPIPSGGSVGALVRDGTMLVGDAAGLTHPVTGAGILNAVVSGMLAGKAAGGATCSGDLCDLASYEREWSAFMGTPLEHALNKRREMDAQWTRDPDALSATIRQTWIAFRAYSHRNPSH
jgi:flavin-dependent dehydrogenase